MKKIDMSQLITLFANIGVIVSILILAIEVNQNTKAQSLLAAQQVLGLSYSNNTALAMSDMPEISAAIDAGQESTPGERNRYFQNLRAIFAALWQVHFQYEQGFLDEEVFDAYAWRTCNLVRNPLILDWWNENRLGFGESFRNFVGDCETVGNAE